MSVSNHRLLKGAGAAVAVFIAFGLITDLLPNPIWARMVSRTLLDYAFLGATSILAGVYVVQRDLLAETPGDACAYAGGIGGFLAFGCPICNHLLLVLFSSSAIMTYFDPLRPLIGAISVALFGGIILYRHRQLSGTVHSQVEEEPPGDSEPAGAGS